MARTTARVPPASEEQEEMTVIVLRFKGSGDSLRKGFEAVGQALAAISPPQSALSEPRKLAARAKALTAASDADDAISDIEVEDSFDGSEVADAVPKVVRAASTAPRKRHVPKFDSSLDLEQGETLRVYCQSKNPVSEQEKYLVAAAWLTEQGGKADGFRGNDIFTCFRGMGWPQQKDFTQPMRQLAFKKSYFESLGKGLWKLTTLGLRTAQGVSNANGHS